MNTVKKIREALVNRNLTKVRMKVSLAGTVDGKEVSYQPGQVAFVEATHATAWIAAGHAEAVEVDTPITEAAALETNDFAMHDPYAYYASLGVPPENLKG